MSGVDTSFYSAAISQCLGNNVSAQRVVAVGGGCINNAVVADTSHGRFFLKWNATAPADMFEKEARGLALLSRSKTIKIPEVSGQGTLDGKHFLVLEYIGSATKAKHFWEDFGEGLATLHRQTTSLYGLDHDNYIGRLPQYNTLKDSWADFFINQRLEPQLLMAIENGLTDSSFVQMYRRFYDLIPGLLPTEEPSLLHGDLWSGNFMVGPEGQACLIDPAVYYGHREIELAFTTMFGGFDEDFYRAYQQSWPLEPGWRERFDIYNIYPSMVHANLFGASYLYDVKTVLRRHVR